MKKISNWYKFTIASACALGGAAFLFQLVDPSLYGEKHPLVCWIAGGGLILFAAYLFWYINKTSGGSSNMVK